MDGHSLDHLTVDERRHRLAANSAVLANQQAAHRFARQIAPADRLPREERLRSIAGLRGSPVMPLSAWRGRSGRRYVVGVHMLAAGLDEPEPAVIIAARRGDIGGAVLVSAIALEADPSALTEFLDAARAAGATELHMHRLAATPAERAAILADLIDPPAAG